MTMLGLKHSEETKKKISKRLKGQHHSPVTEFKKVLKDYISLCYSCHEKYDRKFNKKYKKK